MKRVALRLGTRWNPPSAATILLVVVACLAAAGAAAWPAMASARTVARGIADPNIIDMSNTSENNQQAAALQEIGGGLGATYVRFTVSWARAEPNDPAGPQATYDPQAPYDPNSDYMAHVASAVSAANQDGLKVMITFYDVPEWAFNSKLNDVYQPNDAMLGSAQNLSYFQDFCQAFAAQFAGQVYAYECWNEPNLWLFLKPQKTAGDKNFAAHLYVKMLRSFSAGIRAGDQLALRVAGATAPTGSDRPSVYNTSPQRFAAVIKAAKDWSSLFDAYSHHPYTPGASPRLWPEAVPGDPNKTVGLQNLGVLLKIFPKKPFFLSEYGYQTAACNAFAGQHVDQITQATYLRRAYAYVARYPQVKMLMWYLLKDTRPAPPASPRQGFYTGLRTVGGAAKRSWYAFARGNQLTLSATPAPIKRGSTLTLTGSLSCAGVGGGVGGKALVVQRRLPGRSWSTLKTVYSQVGDVYTQPGTYLVELRPKASAHYRVAFLGVVTSPSRFVAVN